MGAKDLKEYIISRIRLTTDADFLMKVKEFIDVDNAHTYTLSNEQVQLVEESDLQYKEGNYIDATEMNSKVDEWQKEK